MRRTFTLPEEWGGNETKLLEKNAFDIEVLKTLAQNKHTNIYCCGQNYHKSQTPYLRNKPVMLTSAGASQSDYLVFLK